MHIIIYHIYIYIHIVAKLDLNLFAQKMNIAVGTSPPTIQHQHQATQLQWKARVPNRQASARLLGNGSFPHVLQYNSKESSSRLLPFFDLHANG